MKYHIARNGEQLGEFSEEQIRAGLAGGNYLADDLAWAEGMSDWQPLSSLFATAPPPVRPPMPRATPPSLRTIPAEHGGSGLATASLILGILSFVGSFITGIPAIICGHVALSRISRAGDGRGRGRAVTGLILGYFCSFVLGILAVLAALAVPVFAKVQEKANQTKALNHARQILIGMKIYASDHGGKYPDSDPSKPATANDAFRLMFKEGQIDVEGIFGCPASQDGRPDGNIGGKPDFSEAVRPGENHWAMTKGLSDTAPANLPLIFENPSEVTWPPRWNANLAGTGKPGRAWTGGKIIIGFNDGSAQPLPLESARGESVGLKPRPDGTPVFPEVPGRKMEILPVAR